MPIEIDFSQAESFEPLDEGEYPVVVAKVEMREGEKGPYLNWELDVHDGVHENRKLWMITSLSSKALFRLKEAFDAVDVYQEKIKVDWDDETGIVHTPELAGLAATAVVTQEVYQGRIQNRVNQLLDPSSEGRKSKNPTAGADPRRRDFR